MKFRALCFFIKKMFSSWKIAPIKICFFMFEKKINNCENLLFLKYYKILWYLFEIHKLLHMYVFDIFHINLNNSTRKSYRQKESAFPLYLSYRETTILQLLFFYLGNLIVPKWSMILHKQHFTVFGDKNRSWCLKSKWSQSLNYLRWKKLHIVLFRNFWFPVLIDFVKTRFPEW